MPRAVRFNEYGDVEVLEVVDVPRPTPGSGQVLVAVKAAGINPLETSIRSGAMKEVFPTTFPAGQGLDLAGQVVELDEAVGGDVQERHGTRKRRCAHGWPRRSGSVF